MKRLHLLRGVLAFASSAFLLAAGTVDNPTEKDLRAAISNGGTVVFNCDGTITLTNTIQLTESITLEGNGRNIAISGGNAVRLFTVAEGIELKVNGVTLADGADIGANGTPASGPDPAQPGMDARGGAILNLGGHVRLADCLLTHHLALGGNAGHTSFGPVARGGHGLGGAIYSQGGTLILTNCVLSDCQSLGGAGNSWVDGAGEPGLGKGGAIYVEGASLQLFHCTLSLNLAKGAAASGGDFVKSKTGSGEGGGIYATNSAISFFDSGVVGNVAASEWGKGSDVVTADSGRGGALFLTGSSTGLVERCAFRTNNAASGGASRNNYGGDGLGGAIASISVLTVSDSIFNANSVAGGRSLMPGTGQGGAIWSTGDLRLIANTFVGNSALGGTGTSEAFGAPGREASGGAIWASNAFSSTNCTFTANQAVGGLGAPIGGGLPASGAGFGGALAFDGAQANLVHLTIAENATLSATESGSPAAAVGGGGGIFVKSNATVRLKNSILAANTNGSNASGMVVDEGFNLSSDGTPDFSETSSHTNIDPLLAALADNGGPTPTMALLVGSPARDAIPDPTFATGREKSRFSRNFSTEVLGGKRNGVPKSSGYRPCPYAPPPDGI